MLQNNSVQTVKQTKIVHRMLKIQKYFKIGHKFALVFWFLRLAIFKWPFPTPKSTLWCQKRAPWGTLELLLCLCWHLFPRKVPFLIIICYFTVPLGLRFRSGRQNTPVPRWVLFVLPRLTLFSLPEIIMINFSFIFSDEICIYEFHFSKEGTIYSAFTFATLKM